LQSEIDEAINQTRQRAELKIRGLEEQIQLSAGRNAQIKGIESYYI
jgi:hypothetical protein